MNEMTEDELNELIKSLYEKARKAEMAGIMNEYEVYVRKVMIAKSYLVDESKIDLHKIYQLKDTDEYFKVEYLKGIFAWGYRIRGNGEEEGLPVAILKID
ncbi:uncharacterized protein DUF1811 [Abyssicoccus albus]|uniref:Uncharacterized protein DUF1811 n=2 Tax=Abyssicoccus albus TaxID=1817405 RepID=A0A3N5CDH1_9BACL|nr:uncharacterized protein DUF1811 [Abyssicoccus albus]